MLGTDPLAERPELDIVEIAEIARGDADRADAKAAFQLVDAIEIDQPLQRLLQRRRVVIAERLRAARRPDRRRRNARREEAGHAEGRDDRGRLSLKTVRLLSPLTRDSRAPARRPSPRIPCRRSTRFSASIAGDDRGVDRADRNAGDPFRLEAVAAQRLEDAGLIGAEGSATLQYEHTARVRRGRRGVALEMICHGRSVLVPIAYRNRGTVASVHDSVNQRNLTQFCAQAHQLRSVDAKISVQKTLYLVLGA